MKRLAIQICDALIFCSFMYILIVGSRKILIEDCSIENK